MSGGKCCVNRYRAHSVLKQISEQGCNVGVDHQAINIAFWNVRMSYTKRLFCVHQNNPNNPSKQACRGAQGQHYQHASAITNPVHACLSSTHVQPHPRVWAGLAGQCLATVTLSSCIRRTNSGCPSPVPSMTTVGQERASASLPALPSPCSDAQCPDYLCVSKQQLRDPGYYPYLSASTGQVTVATS